MKILIIKNDGIGDLILASGLISYIGANISQELDLLTCEQNRDIASKIENVDNTYYVSRDSIKSYSILNTDRIKVPYKLANDNYKLSRFTKNEELIVEKLNQNGYDLVIVLRRYVRESSLILFNSIVAHKKLCMWETTTNLSYKRAKTLSARATHYTSYNIDMFINSELEYYEAILSKYFKKKIYANPNLKLQNLLKNKKSRSIGLIISGSSIKIATSNWENICKYLYSENYDVVLYGGRTEIKISDEIISKLPYVRSQVSKCSFNEYEKEFLNMFAIIGNDTGLTHFAYLIHKKVLVLMGGGTFKSFFPWRQSSSQNILYHHMECYNCTWVCTQEIKYECLVKLFENQKLLNSEIKKFLN